LINIEFKENAWKYNNLEKLEIVILGVNGLIKNICSNFNIAESTFRRWRQKIYSTSEKIFQKDTSTKGNLKSLEGNSLEAASKAKLLSMTPSDILNSLKASDEYKSYYVEAINSKDSISINDACKSIGISEKAYYKNKDASLGDARLKYPALTALDILLDNNGIDKDSLMLKMLSASIPVTRSDAGNFRWQAQIYIRKHKLKDIPKVYQFAETDNCWSMDFKNFYDENDNVTYLLKIIDERSRMDIANIVTSNATTKTALELINKALESTGRKPFAIKTDRGTQFKISVSGK